MSTIPEAFSIAVEHHRAGRVEAAEPIYRRILELDPDHAYALHLLGVLVHQSGQHEQAIEYLETAIRINGDEAAFHGNLGDVYCVLRRYPQAIAAYRRALALRPGIADAYNAEVSNNLGNVLYKQGDLADAVSCFDTALQCNPDHVEALCNLGTALSQQQEEGGDKPRLEKRGTDLKQSVDAVACFRRALQLKPDHVASLGKLIQRLKHHCDWGELHDLERRAMECLTRQPAGRSGVEPLTPFSLMTFAMPPTTAAQQFLGARRWVEQHFRVEMEAGRRRTFPFRSAPQPVINVGYLSADFREHPVGHQIANLIEKHDRSRFAIYGYAYGNDDGSEIRRRLVRGCDRFADLRDASHRQAADRIAADGVQILVDLTGYTSNARTEILALRPAPVQVNYLGYPGTLGAPFMDYILVDEFVVPSDQQPHFSEHLVHLPGSFMVTDGQRDVSPRTPSRAECGLPETGFVFCAFNNSFKITPEVFGVWMELLRAVRGSVLWLSKWSSLAIANLRREAAAHGVADDRLVFAPRLPAVADHLARYWVADLFLDTFPYNAHATASDALWAGCPVLTRIGETFPARVAGSLLRAIGLPELITTSRDEYRELALRLATDAEPLAGLRARLEANRRTAPLFDTERFARSIEDAFTTMWKTYCSGAEPRAFAVGGCGMHASAQAGN